MGSPLATVEPSQRYPIPWPHNRESKETFLQCVKVYASSAPAQATDSTSSHATLVSRPKSGKSATRLNGCKSGPQQKVLQSVSRPKTGKSSTRLNDCKSGPQQKVLQSIEHSPKKYLDSGIEYSIRRYRVGAGKVVEDMAADANITTSILPSSRSTSISTYGLNSDMGKGRDHDWVPSSTEVRDAEPFSRSLSSFNPGKHDRVLPTTGADRRGTHWEIVDLEASPSPSSSPTQALKSVKYELEDGQDLLRRASPPTWNFNLRSRKLEEEGVVEIPKEIVEHEKTLGQLAAQLKLMQAKEREEKGKRSEREANGHIDCAAVNIKKRKAADDDETMGLRKTAKKEHNETHDSGVHVRASLGNTELAIQPTYQVAHIRTDQGLSQCNRAPKYPWQSGYRRHLTKYEKFRMPKACRKQCTCQLMPAYFTQTIDFVPSLATWRGSRLEFLEHVKQLSSCSGHPPSVRDACYRMLEKEYYPESLGPSIAMSFAERCPKLTTTTSRSQGLQPLTNPKISNVRTALAASTSGRLLSDIGKLSAPNSLPLGPNAIISRISRDRSASSPLGTSVGDQQKPPPSSPSTNGPRDAGMDSDQQVHLETQADNFEGGHIQFLEKAAAVPPRMLPRTPFGVQRKRHQSMPATFSGRRQTRSPQHQEKTLQGATERLSANGTVPGPETLLHGFSAILDQLKKVAETFNQTSNDQSHRTRLVGNALPPPPPPSPPPPTGAAAAADRGQPARRKKQTDAQRRAGGAPQLDRDVPHHLRESDEILLEIGKKPNGYQRHKLAPYAFSYRGRLYKEYIGLLTARDQQGNSVWDCEVMSRVRQ